MVEYGKIIILSVQCLTPNGGSYVNIMYVILLTLCRFYRIYLRVDDCPDFGVCFIFIAGIVLCYCHIHTRLQVICY